jgi:hypothetical protein
MGPLSSISSQPTHLRAIADKIAAMVSNNQSASQLEEQQKIDAYLKVYADQPDKIQEILKALELYQQNDWQPTQPTTRWY